jgi:hypothetical protein
MNYILIFSLMLALFLRIFGVMSDKQAEWFCWIWLASFFAWIRFRK